MPDASQILNAIEQGDPRAAEQLLPLVYEELRKLAAQKLAQERPGQSLQATALVHEAYLRLVDVEKSPHWDSRGHFFAAAAEAMRRILVEKARSKKRLRHGGDRQRLDLDQLELAGESPPEALLAFDEALAKLAREAAAVANVVKLHHFAGLTLEQIASALDISPRTVRRHWAFAKAWFFQELHSPGEPGQ